MPFIMIPDGVLLKYQLAEKKLKQLPKQSESQEPFAANPKWIMKYAEARFDITDLKSMMAHHTIVWNTVVLASDPWTMYEFNAASIVPRKTSDINFRVREESSNGRILGRPKIIDMSRGNLHHKAFMIELQDPLMPHDETRTLYIEYDWEEPDRFYQYVIGNLYKTFKFVLTSPPEFQIEPVVYRIDNATGEKIAESEEMLTEKQLEDGRLFFEWTGKDLQFSTYTLDFTK